MNIVILRMYHHVWVYAIAGNGSEAAAEAAILQWHRDCLPWQNERPEVVSVEFHELYQPVLVRNSIEVEGPGCTEHSDEPRYA